MSEGRRVMVAVILVLGVVGLVACAKPPQAAIDAANSELAAARNAEASSYAPEAWETAQNSMNAAQAEIEAQQAKFAPLRSYKKANELLAAAEQDAEAAGSAAIEAKAAARAEVEQAIATIEADLATADELLAALTNCRRRPKGFASDLEILRGNVDGLRAQVSGVQSTVDEGQLLEAKVMANELSQQIAVVVNDLENAKAKLGC